MKKYNVAVLGATGAVGREMLKVLEERRFPIATLRPLASARSAGKALPFCGERVTVEEAGPRAFEGMDIVLGAAQADLAREMAPAVVRAGAVFVDNSRRVSYARRRARWSFRNQPRGRAGRTPASSPTRTARRSSR